MGIQSVQFIELSNFGSYKDTFNITLPLGLTGIVGRHDTDVNRSNGVGKSTLVNSIIYALYGEGEFATIDELVNVYSKNSTMYVKVGFIDSRGNTIIIERGRKSNQSYLIVLENNNPIHSKTIAKTQKDIEQIVQMDYHMFTSSVFFEQGKLDKFINVEPSIRRQYIDKILNLDVWRKSLKVSISKSKTLEQEKKLKHESFEKAQLQKIAYEKELEQLENIEIKIEENQNILDDTEKKIKQIEDYYVLHKELAGYADQIQYIDKSIKNQYSTLESLNTQISQMLTQVQEYETQLSKKQEEVKAHQEKLNQLLSEKKLDELTSKITAIDIQIENKKKAVLHANSELLALQKQLLNISEGKCPTCLQEVSKSYLDSYNAEINHKIMQKKSELDIRDKEQKELLESKKSLEKEKLSLEQTIAELQNSILLLEKEGKNIIAFKSQTLSNLDSTKLQISNIEEVIKEHSAKLSELLAAQTTIKEKLQQIKFNENDMLQLQKQRDEVKKNLEELHQLLGKKVTLTNLIQSLNHDIQVLQEDINNLQHSIVLNNAVAVVFKKIPTDLFSNSVQSIMQVSNDLIAQVLPEISTLIYEDQSSGKLFIDFLVDNVKRSYKRLSGGQKTVVDLGLRLGFSQVIMKRCASHIGFIVLDEPFGALDIRNRQLVDSLLIQLSRVFNQILVISHVGDMDVYPNIITVRMNSENISYIE